MLPRKKQPMKDKLQAKYEAKKASQKEASEVSDEGKTKVGKLKKRAR